VPGIRLSTGVSLHVVAAGHAEPPILFIHGGLCDHRSWGPQLAALSALYRCVAPDMRGTGSTSARKPFTVFQQARDLAALGDVLRLRSAVCVGHSLGGLVALLLNRERPDLVRGIVTIDTPLFPHSLPPQALSDAILSDDTLDPLAESIEMMTANSAPPVQRLVSSMMRSCSPEVAAGTLSGLEALADELPSLLVKAADRPFLSIWPASLPDEDRRWLDALVPRGENAVLEGTSHFPHLDAPDEVNSLLAAFLGEPFERP
jgi:pimeloyl-ACP methyl ester carboxylesterase